MSTYKAEDWISTRQAATLLGVQLRVIQHLVNARKITSRVILGCHPEVLRSEILALSETVVRPPRAPVQVKAPARARA
jgi:hypothetical protein